MSALLSFLALARHPFVYDAVEVALLGDNLGLPRGVKCALAIGIHALVVHPAALWVAENLVGFVDFDEARLGVVRLRYVGVKPARQAAVSRFDIAGSRPIRKSENAVKVFHTGCCPVLIK